MQPPQVKILLLLRCIEPVYAEKMIKQGSLYFNYPINWIKKAEKEGKMGQGDPLEGVYADVINDSTLRFRPDSELTTVEGKTYLRSHSVVNDWLCCCFYGVRGSSLKRDEDGNLVSYIGDGYISSFNKGIECVPMQGVPADKQMATVNIQNPTAFVQKVKRFFSEKGLVEETEYYMGVVNYRNKEEGFKPLYYPCELFSKDARFSDQQEFRIILDSRSPKVKKMLNGGQEILIGSLEDCAILAPYYYEGVRFVIDFKNRMRVSILGRK